MTDRSESSLVLLMVRVVLAIALLGALLLAGWSVYRQLPAAIDQTAMTREAATTGARLLVRNKVTKARLHSPVELFHFDLAAVQREYEQSPKLARQFDDFLVRRMHNVAPVKANVNVDGFATAQLTPGDWWLRATATLDTGEEIEWRVPFAIGERDQTIDLSLENAYERRKKF